MDAYDREERLVRDIAIWFMNRDGDDGDPDELLYSTGPIPEPWGVRWQKFEQEARELVGLMTANVEVQRCPAEVGADGTAEYLTKCPQCGGVADNGYDRCIPPSAYMCSKCAQEDAERAATTTHQPATWIDDDLEKTGGRLANKKDLLDCIEELVEQFADVRDDGLLDSMAIGALADAMRLLATNGRMTITYDRGRRVMAMMVPNAGVTGRPLADGPVDRRVRRQTDGREHD